MHSSLTSFSIPLLKMSLRTFFFYKSPHRGDFSTSFIAYCAGSLLWASENFVMSSAVSAIFSTLAYTCEG